MWIIQAEFVHTSNSLNKIPFLAIVLEKVNIATPSCTTCGDICNDIVLRFWNNPSCIKVVICLSDCTFFAPTFSRPVNHSMLKITPTFRVDLPIVVNIRSPIN